MTDGRRENCEILNLTSYERAKFDLYFVRICGFITKADFYKSQCLGVANSIDTVKNRQDLFGPF